MEFKAEDTKKFDIEEKVTIKNFTERSNFDFYNSLMEKYIGQDGVVEENDCLYPEQIYKVRFSDGDYWYFLEDDLEKYREKMFEIVEEYKDIIDESFLPQRSDDGSAGYDLRAAEDVVIPSILRLRQEAFINAGIVADEDKESLEYAMNEGYVPTLEEAEELTKEYDLRAVYVPTGLKAKFPKDHTLDVVDRSSVGTKLLLSLPHAVGIVDSSYYNNENNEGHILVPFINHLPFDVKIKKGERIAQAIFRPYAITSNDKPKNKVRTGGVGSSGR